jgi:hypothetical protein
MLEEGNDTKFGKIENVYDRNYFDLIPYFRDSVVYIADTIKGDSTRVDSVIMRPINYQIPTGQVDVEVFFPRKISITYNKKRPEPEYLKKMNLPKNVPYPISYIDLKYAIGIMENGYYYDQKDWVSQGYWSWKNLADQLPYDYFP